nr:DUF6516 family protein [uncultured Rhodopila sp.]
MVEADHALDFLLSLNGSEFRLECGYVVKIEARSVAATPHRPQGLKYSLTLHDLAGQRIYGMDNAHGLRRAPEYDHRHVYGRRKLVPYQYRGPAELLEDFYREVDRILIERGLQ